MPTSVQKIIGGRTFSFGRCSATDAIDLQLSLMKVGASDLGNVDWSSVSTEMAKGGDAAKIAIGLQIADIAGGIAQKLTKAELIRLMVLVFAHTSCDGRTIGDDIDRVFADRPADTWEAFIEALKVNLGPLVDVLRKNSTATSATAKLNP